MTNLSTEKSKGYTRQIQGDWVDVKNAVLNLGRGYSRSSIFRKIQRGDFLEGVHFARPSDRTLKINIAVIKQGWEFEGY